MQPGGAGRGAGTPGGTTNTPGQQQQIFGTQHIEAARQQNLEKILKVIKTYFRDCFIKLRIHEINFYYRI